MADDAKWSTDRAETLEERFRPWDDHPMRGNARQKDEAFNDGRCYESLPSPFPSEDIFGSSVR